MANNIIQSFRNRILQFISRNIPGGTSLRVYLHRKRGVKIGNNTWIGYDAILETEHPEFIKIGNDVNIGISVIIIAHFFRLALPEKGKEKEFFSVIIEDNCHIGPGSIIMPNVKIGSGSVIAAGSVVTKSIPPRTLARGNPAEFIAKCGIPLVSNTSYKDFLRNLKPIKKTQKK